MRESESRSGLAPGRGSGPDADSERTLLVRAVRGITALSVAGLVLVVLSVGVVAFLAELAKTWTWYFRMEQAMAFATPIVVALLVVSVVGCLGVVAASHRD